MCMCLYCVLLCAAFWQADWSVCVCVIRTRHPPHQSIKPHWALPPHCSQLPQSIRREVAVSRASSGVLGVGSKVDHDRSFKMTVARMRKKVFQPRVTAKPRHTMNRDRPQPVGKNVSGDWRTLGTALVYALTLHPGHSDSLPSLEAHVVLQKRKVSASR